MSIAQRVLSASKGRGRNWLIQDPRARSYVSGGFLSAWIRTFPKKERARLRFIWFDGVLTVLSDHTRLHLKHSTTAPPRFHKHRGPIPGSVDARNKESLRADKWKRDLPARMETATPWAELEKDPTSTNKR